MTMMGKRLIIGQINARRSPPVMEILGRVSIERTMDILLIQEPPLALVRWEWYFPGYRMYVASGPNPLTAVMVHVSLLSRSVDLEGDRVCGVVVSTKLGNFWVFSAYICYLIGVGLDQLSRGLELAASSSCLRFVGMDSNGHSPLWGPTTVHLDGVGRMVEETLSASNMFILNDPAAPPSYHGDQGQQAWIDVTAASPSLTSRVSHWSVCTSLTLSSDHFLIQTIVDLAPSWVRVRQIPDWAATDWRRFSAMLQATLGLAPSQPLPSTEALDVAIDYLTACIQLTTATVVPKKRACVYSRPWWHPGLTDLRRDIHHWHRRWLRSGRVFARERYLLARRAFRTAIVVAKWDSWHRLCSETSRADLWSLYKKFSCKGDYSVVDTLKLDGHVVSVDTDKASALAPVFFPSLPPVSDWRQAEIDHSWSTHRPPGVPGSVEVSIAEVVSVVCQMRPKAAPGLDDIPVSVLKENLYIIAPWLALIYTASLLLHYFPESWKTAKVIPLKKPDKSSYSTPHSYRPISLLSHLGKALERIVNQRLMRQLESRCLLSPFRFGFRAGRQAVSVCLWITEDIYSAFRCGQQVQAVALDLQSAYDTVWRAGLLEKLSVMGVDWYIICWVQSFFEGRMARLMVGESAVEVATSCRVPQGSPISPTLFLVFIDDLLLRLQHLGRLRFQGFADDMILWIMGYLRYGRIHPCLRYALWRAERWSQFWQISSAPRSVSVSPSRGNQLQLRGALRLSYTGSPYRTPGCFGTWGCGSMSASPIIVTFGRRSRG